jgi:hypothetical protein
MNYLSEDKINSNTTVASSTTKNNNNNSNAESIAIENKKEGANPIECHANYAIRARAIEATERFETLSDGPLNLSDHYALKVVFDFAPMCQNTKASNNANG